MAKVEIKIGKRPGELEPVSDNDFHIEPKIVEAMFRSAFESVSVFAKEWSETKVPCPKPVIEGEFTISTDPESYVPREGYFAYDRPVGPPFWEGTTNTAAPERDYIDIEATVVPDGESCPERKLLPGNVEEK